jgi:hypothetical protein
MQKKDSNRKAAPLQVRLTQLPGSPVPAPTSTRNSVLCDDLPANFPLSNQTSKESQQLQQKLQNRTIQKTCDDIYAIQIPRFKTLKTEIQ